MLSLRFGKRFNNNLPQYDGEVRSTLKLLLKTSTLFVSSVRSSNSHPDLLLIQQQQHPTFSDHTGPQHCTFTF